MEFNRQQQIILHTFAEEGLELGIEEAELYFEVRKDGSSNYKYKEFKESHLYYKIHRVVNTWRKDRLRWLAQILKESER
jgi:hypothetical protein